MIKKDGLSKRLEFSAPTLHQLYSLINQIEEIKGQWRGGIRLAPQILNKLKKANLITSSGASTRIEGSLLTDEQVEKLLDGLKIQKLKTRDEQEVAGYAELLNNVFNSWPDIKLSESSIKHFHKELLKYSDKDVRHRGNYKSLPNRVEAKNEIGEVVGVLFDPTPPHLVDKEMKELLDWTINTLAEKKIHSLIIVGAFIFEFLSIHPFQDGNGRLSRVLTNFLLLKEGYEYTPYVSHEKIIEDNKKEYYLSLHQGQKIRHKKKEDITAWILFFLKTILKQSEMALALVTADSIESLLSEKQLAVWNYILEKGIVTPRDIQEDLKIPVPTILQSLNKLLKLKKIERMGAGRGTRYRLIK